MPVSATPAKACDNPARSLPSDGPTATQRETSNQRAIQGSVAVSPLDRLRLQLALGRTDDDTENVSSEPFSFDNSQYEASNRSATLSAQWRFADGFAATAAYEFLRQEGSSTAYDPTFGGTLTEFSPTLADLRSATHWNRIVDRKQVPLAFIRSKA